MVVEGQPEHFQPFAPTSQGHAEAVFYLAQAHRSGSPEMGVPQDLQQFGEMVQQAAMPATGVVHIMEKTGHMGMFTATKKTQRMVEDFLEFCIS